MKEKDFLSNFETTLNKKKKWAISGIGVIFVGTLLVNLGILVFGIWVIVKLMQHFGVI